MFLSKAELEDLTGLVQPAAQIRWLRKNGIDHYVRSDGKPRVPREAIGKTTTTGSSKGPNFDAIRARQ